MRLCVELLRNFAAPKMTLAAAGRHFVPVQIRPARSIFSKALNFRRSAIAALVRSP
jgi:hypothetical protein